MKSRVRPALTTLFSTLSLAVLMTGCGQSESSQEEAGPPYAMVATTGMVSDLVKNIAGYRAELDVLIPAGTDPHMYQPTRTDQAKLVNAELVFYNGLHLEGKMDQAFAKAGEAGIGVHAVTELIEKDSLLSPEGLEGQFDPHVWMDPQAWIKTIEPVRDILIALDANGSQAYTSNAAGYIEELQALDAYAVEVLSTVPQGQRVLVTAHDAFNYFGHRFGFEVVGIQGISTESEAGVQDIEKLVDLLVTRNIGAVFVESTVSDRNIEALVAGAAAQGHRVVIGGELFSDAMGPAGTYEGTYIGMIDHNVTTIALALGGEAPEKGLNGLLGEAKAIDEFQAKLTTFQTDLEGMLEDIGSINAYLNKRTTELDERETQLEDREYELNVRELKIQNKEVKSSASETAE